MHARRQRGIAAIVALGAWAGTARATPQFVSHARLFEVTQPGGLRRTVPAVEMNRTAAEFYDYRSASSHTGYERARRSILFLHRDLRDDRLSLIITHGIDDLGQPAADHQPSARVFFDLDGVPAGAAVTRSDDDAGEFGLGHDPEGNWDFADNTDGGVVSGLPIDADWAITITPDFRLGIDDWAYHFADGTDLFLDVHQPVTIESRGASVGSDALQSEEGTPVTLCSLAVDDRGAVGLLAYEVDWGDGGVPTRRAMNVGELFCADHTYLDDGAFAIHVTATNPFDEQAVKVVAAAIANVAPVVAAGGPYPGAEGQSVLLRAALVSDPGTEDTQQVRWDFDGDGTWDTDFGDDLAVEHVYPGDGAFRARVEMRDDDGGTGAAEADVTIANLPPVFTSAPLPTVTIGSTWTYAPAATDPGNDPVTFALLDAPEGMALEQGVASWTPLPEDVGVHAFQVIALDDGNGATAQDVTVTVLPNQSPTPAIDPAEPVLPEGARLVVDASGSADPEGDALSFDWRCDPGLPVEVLDGGARLALDAERLDGPAGPFACRLTVADALHPPVELAFGVRVVNASPVIQRLQVGDAAEGEAVAVGVQAADPAPADTLAFSVDCDGDGLLDVIDAQPIDLQCTFADDGDYVVTVVATDDDGDSGTATAPVDVANLPPVLQTPACPPAIEGIPLTLPLLPQDPAGDHDTVRCSMADLPAGTALDAAQCVVFWVPTYDQAVAGSVEFAVDAADEDGGSAAVRFECPVQYRDEDGDGLPDTWRREYGLQGGCDADPDGDGLTNCQEFDGGTDPNRFDGPGAPVPVAPEDGATVATATPDLVVRDATDPLGRPLSYEFTLFADGAPVATSMLVAETPGQTSWAVPAGTLEEGATYTWSARAHDGLGFGPPSAASSFTVDAVQAAPSAPVIRQPEDGDRVRAARLVVDGSVDPDAGDAITYECQIAGDAAFGDVARAPSAPALPDGPTTLPVDPALDEDVVWYARCRAVDAAGHASDWSATVSFTVDAANDPPTAPTILAPEHGSIVDTPDVVLRVGNAQDADGDPLTYRFWLSDDPTFPPDRTRVSDELPGGDDGRTGWAVPDPLPEDSVWFWRVRARDPQVAGPFASARFRVSRTDGPPTAPEPLNPAAGTRSEAQPRFVWTAATDPEGAPVTYRVELYDASDATAWSTDTTERTADCDHALAPGPYAWRVRATDPQGNASDWSARTPFVVPAPPVLADAAEPDAAEPDAAIPDAAIPDAATSDGAAPDAAAPDAASRSGAAADGCACDASGGSGPFPFVLLLGLSALVRRRRCLLAWLLLGCGTTSGPAAAPVDGGAADASSTDGARPAPDVSVPDVFVADATRTAVDADAMRPVADASVADAAPMPPDAAPDAGADAGPPACHLAPDAPLVLLYASVGGDDNLRFLHDDCSAEVVVGEKRVAGPRSAMKRPEARARGGRSAFVSDLNGQRIRDALRRDDGVARTAAELRQILDAGYDYIVIDEITAASDWDDDSLVSRRFRSLLEQLPPRTVIAYISLDLTMAADGADLMNARRQLLYALMQRGRALALEVYLHTGAVRSGQAPDALRRAATRLRNAVLDLPGGGHIDEHAISVLGVSIHQPSPYDYLDDPAHDLAAVRTEARTVRTFGALLPAQRGLGYYFVDHSDLVPAAGAPYDFDDLIDVMADEAHQTALAVGH
jgi:uncharacterized protein (TIGR03382 family)